MVTETVKAWQCIGCGKIESPQTCVGICQDRKVEMVYAQEHREAIARLRTRIGELEAVVRQIAYTTPRKGEWESSYRALQKRAREVSAATANAKFN